jgi:hypothetical protein
MADKRNLGGLWVKTTRTGRTLYEGTFPLKDRNPSYPDIVTIIEALKELLEAGEEKVVITVWVNDDKPSERHPDMSMQLSAPWKAEQQDKPAEAPVKAPTLVDDDIPF